MAKIINYENVSLIVVINNKFLQKVFVENLKWRYHKTLNNMYLLILLNGGHNNFLKNILTLKFRSQIHYVCFVTIK